MSLGEDHTKGTTPGANAPDACVASNDLAVGKLVEAATHSKYWNEMAIFIIEDDAQNGPDHVDATRTIAFAAGPYVRRNTVVRDRYDQLSMLRTVELILGLKPLNLTDAMAVPMFGVLTSRPDFTPFVAVAPSDRLADADRERDRGLNVR